MNVEWLLSMPASLVCLSARRIVHIHRCLLSLYSMRMVVFVTETVPVRTVNRQCSSGLQAVADVAAAIRAGFYDIGKQTKGLNEAL